VTQNTQYEQSVIQVWASYVNQSIKIGNYKACDLVTIDETNVEFYLASGTTLAGHGEGTIGCATLQAHPQGVLFCLASPWMVRNSLHL
jgi:hypothetical protein